MGHHREAGGWSPSCPRRLPKRFWSVGVGGCQGGLVWGATGAGSGEGDGCGQEWADVAEPGIRQTVSAGFVCVGSWLIVKATPGRHAVGSVGNFCDSADGVRVGL